MIGRMLFVSAAVLVLLSGLGTVSAQDNVKLVADIPFEFHVGESVFPAGTYSFGSSPASRQVLMIAGEQGRVFALTYPAGPANGSTEWVAVFNKYADGACFLHEVRIPDQVKRELPLTRHEKESITTDWSLEQIALVLKPAGRPSGR